MAEFKPQDFLTGNVTATDVEKLKKKELIMVAKELDAELFLEGKAKAEIKGKFIAGICREKFAEGYYESERFRVGSRIATGIEKD